MDPRIIFARLYVSLQNFSLKREEGQTMAEYGVVLALITLAVVATIGLLGTQINTKLSDVLHALGG
jgi:pilus assembly protein Flp/PilA